MKFVAFVAFGLLIWASSALVPASLLFWATAVGAGLGAVVQFSQAVGDRRRLLDGTATMGVAVVLFALGTVYDPYGFSDTEQTVAVIAQTMVFGILTLALAIASSVSPQNAPLVGMNDPGNMML